MDKKEFFKDKSILYIPIVSMRSHESNIYDLTKDGNIMRILTFISNYINVFSNIELVLPSNITNASKHLLTYVLNTNKKLKIHYCDNYPINAYENRTDVNNKICNYVLNNFLIRLKYDFDVIIYESPQFIISFNSYLKRKKVKKIFWSPVSPYVFKKGNVSNLKFPEFYSHELSNLDIEAAKLSDVLIVSSKEQKNYYEGILNKNKKSKKDNIWIINNFFNPHFYIKDNINLPCIDDFIASENDKIKNQFFWPYRLSDKGYKLEQTLKVLNNYLLEGKIRFLYTDPNESKLIEEKYSKLFTNISFVKVSDSSRFNIYSLIQTSNMIYNDLYIHHSIIEEIKYINKNIAIKYLTLNEDENGLNEVV